MRSFGIGFSCICHIFVRDRFLCVLCVPVRPSMAAAKLRVTRIQKDQRDVVRPGFAETGNIP